MNITPNEVFVCFAAKDRYSIAEPVVYHLKNYGIATWYDRHTLLMGDNRKEKNLDEGAAKCMYAVAIISKHTARSKCAMEELSIIKARHTKKEVTVFPVLYELLPNEVPSDLLWVKELIFKEVDRRSGTRETCNHIACKITKDLLDSCKWKNIQDIVANSPSKELPPTVYAILSSYQKIDCENLNSRVALLYSAYLTIISHSTMIPQDYRTYMVKKIFERLFSETRLNLSIDYRELWLLENSLCIFCDSYLAS